MENAAQPTLTEKGKALAAEGKKWIERIEGAWKREDAWKKDAEQAVKAYTNEATGDGKLYDYNILHANVETIVPAIINSPPVPDIRRRFGDADPVGKMLSDILERAIIVQVDDSRLATELEGQAQDGFLAGRGIIRLRFHADTGETETSALHEVQEEAKGEDEAEDDATEEAPGTEGEPNDTDDATAQTVANERFTFEAVSWRDYQHGPAKRWEDRPWESFRHVMQCDDVKEFADKGLVSEQVPAGDLYGDEGADIEVYEIWDLRTKSVIFVDSNGKVLKRLPDPLGLSKFFPTSRPVQPIEIVGRLMPVNPFAIYRKLADELDVITKRIRILTAAMKLKGGVVGAVAADLKALGDADDNELVTMSGLEALAQTAGLEKAILWWPVEKFYPLIKELFSNRDLTKQAIYEITGISDIVRGASKASETLGAQQIKSQWGSLRIQKMQRMMERSARDLFVMMAEIIPNKFSYRTLEEMTKVPILIQPTDNPEQVKAKQQLQALMKSRVTTQYRIDVESESTIRADLTMKKQEAAEFLTGSASYFAAVGPLVQQGTLPAEAAIEIYAANARLFNLGKSVEDVIEQMVQMAHQKAEQEKANPTPPQPSPEQQLAQAQIQATTADQQRKQQEFDARAQEAIAKANAERMQADAKAQADATARANEEAMRLAQHNATMAAIAEKAEAQRVKDQLDIEGKRKDLEIQDIEIEMRRRQLAEPVNTGADAAA